jgi:hypothetical protein
MVALIPLKSSLDSNFYSSDRGKPSHLHETHNEFEGLSIEIEFLRVSEIWWRVVLPLTCQKVPHVVRMSSIAVHRVLKAGQIMRHYYWP